MRPDVLAGLSLNQRRRREAKDLAFLQRQDIYAFVGKQPKDHADDLDVLARRIGLKTYGPDHVPGEHEFCVCIRVDLLNPILLSDNQFGQCVDCGCDIQFRPDLPQRSQRVCICCGARRIRESAKCA